MRVMCALLMYQLISLTILCFRCCSDILEVWARVWGANTGIAQHFEEQQMHSPYRRK